MRRIRDDTNDEAMRVETDDWRWRSVLEVEIMQWSQSPLHLIRELGLDK